MMGYCTAEQIEKQRIPAEQLIQLTDDDERDEINTAVVDEIIASESATIDGYLRGRYTLPLAEPSLVLTGIALDLCAYRLYSRRMALDVPEHINRANTSAISKLRSIASGALKLDAGTQTSGSVAVRCYAV